MIIVKVTRRHIREGTSMSITECPIALALNEYFGLGHGASVTDDTMRVGPVGFAVPASVMRFLGRIDAGKSVKPFSFKLRLL